MRKFLKIGEKNLVDRKVTSFKASKGIKLFKYDGKVP